MLLRRGRGGEWCYSMVVGWDIDLHGLRCHGGVQTHGAAAKGCVCICGPTPARICADVHGPCYHWRSFRCPLSAQQPEAMLMSLGRAATRGSY